MLVLALSGKGRESGYFKCVLLAITGTLDTGNAMIGTLDTRTKLWWK